MNKTPAGLDSDLRQMILQTVSRLENSLLTKEKISEFDQKEIFPEKIIKKLLAEDIGLQLLFIPEKYGGLGGGARDCCEVTAEMAGICLGIATAFFAIQLGADPIIVAGTEKQKAKWLTKIVKKKNLVAYAVTEAGAGSNLAAIKTKAEPVFDQNGKIKSYIINGTKQFISTGKYANFITLLANTPEGPSFFIVEKKMEGFKAGKGEKKHGIKASNTSPLTFDNVIIPAENLIGNISGKGLKQANKVFGYTRLMVAAMAYGAGKTAMQIAVNYAKQRVQFGSLLSEKQGYTHKLIIPNIVKLNAAKAYIDQLAYLIDLKNNAEDFHVEGSIIKYFASETANQAADDAMQALGGYGYISEFEVEKIKRDIKITCIYEGTSEIQQNIISAFRWKKTWKTKGGFYKDIADKMNAKKALEKNCGSQYYALCANILNRLIQEAHKNRLTRNQYIMFLIADIITHLEVGVSLAEKTLDLYETDKKKAEKSALISKIFAGETAMLTAVNTAKIIKGSGCFDTKKANEILKEVSYHKLFDASENSVKDMDKLADIIFERKI
ncbi:MAG: acyl-CoA dehydrogenase family protein [Deltaproteobacteria bacterium]|nr:acyl-CoA dehydrogenase family protein [Deltaproteobacteria bacterium]